MNKPITIYTCQKMSGRYKDEMIREAEYLVRHLNNYGFQVLNPVLAEKVEDVHELLQNVQPALLAHYWQRDKEMIREADIILDYCTEGKSDGTNKEVGYARYCLWKPVVRVWPGPGGLISRLEDDVVVNSLIEAIQVIQLDWGTYEKLGAWREAMWRRSFSKWMGYQRELRTRYGMDTKTVVEG